MTREGSEEGVAAEAGVIEGDRLRLEFPAGPIGVARRALRGIDDVLGEGLD